MRAFSFPRSRVGMFASTLGVGSRHATAGNPLGRGASREWVPTRDRGSQSNAMAGFKSWRSPIDPVLVPTLTRGNVLFDAQRRLRSCDGWESARTQSVQEVGSHARAWEPVDPESCVYLRLTRPSRLAGKLAVPSTGHRSPIPKKMRSVRDSRGVGMSCQSRNSVAHFREGEALSEPVEAIAARPEARPARLVQWQ